MWDFWRTVFSRFWWRLLRTGQSLIGWRTDANAFARRLNPPHNVQAEVHDRRSGLSASPFCPSPAPNATLSLGHEHDEPIRELDMPRRAIAVAVIVILACFIGTGL